MRTDRTPSSPWELVQCGVAAARWARIEKGELRLGPYVYGRTSQGGDPQEESS